MAWVDECLNDSPYALWRPGTASGGTIQDETANNRDATAVGISTNVGGPAGIGTYAGYDGVDDHTLHPVSTFGSSVGTSTCEVVFRTEEASTDTAICGVFNDADDTAYQVLLNFPSAGRTSLWIRGANDVSDVAAWSIGTNIYDGAWHSLAFVVTDLTSASGVAAYVDGSSVSVTRDRADFAAPHSNYEFDLAAGARNVRGTVTFHAEIDIAGLGLYTSALNATRLAAHHTASNDAGESFEDTSIAMSDALTMSADGVAYLDTSVSMSDSLTLAADGQAYLDTSIQMSDALTVDLDGVAFLDTAISMSDSLALSADGVAYFDTSISMAGALTLTPAGVAWLDTSVSMSEALTLDVDGTGTGAQITPAIIPLEWMWFYLVGAAPLAERLEECNIVSVPGNRRVVKPAAQHRAVSVESNRRLVKAGCR